MGGLIRVSLLPSTKPSFLIGTQKSDIVTLLDTGSNFAIWCASEKSLIKSFENVEKTKYIAPIGGFGKGYYLSSVWKIPLIELKSDDKNSTDVLTIKNMLVAVHPTKKYDFSLLLGASSFAELNYTIHNYPKNNRYLEIELTRNTGIYGCTVKYFDKEKAPEELRKQLSSLSDEYIPIYGTAIFYVE